VIPDSAVHVAINLDRPDHRAGQANKVSEALLEQLVPVDLWDRKDRVDHQDRVGHLDKVEIEVGTATEDNQELLEQLDRLEQLDHRDSRDRQVMWSYGSRAISVASEGHFTDTYQ